MIVSILLIVVYCLSAVCAADVNATCDDVKINEGSDIDLLGNQDSCDKLHSCDENQNAGDNGKSLDSIEIHPPQLPHEIYGPIYSKCEDFDELQRLIYEHNVVDLNKDYSLDCDQTFKINTGVTIDGHGHSIKLAHKGQSYIESNFGNVILKNLKIYNGYHNGNGGALVIGGKACFTLINCTFSDNYAVSCGAVYNSNKNPLKIIDCVFKNNKVNFDKRGKGGAICSEGYLEVIGSLFEGNSADGMGAIWCKGDCFIANSTFKNNYANVLFGAVACDGHMSFINSTAEDNYCKEGLYMQIDAYKGITFDEGTYRYKNNAGYDNLSTVSLNKSVVNLWLDDIKDLDILSDYIKNNNPSWGLLNITLAPYACFFVKNNIEDPGCGYAMRLNLGLVVINGNSGSVIRGGDSFFDENADSFADIIPTCNLGMNNVILENFKIAFMNMGNIYCANSNFNHIEKLAYNAGKACFDNCTFKIMDDKSYTYIECIQDSLSVLTECKYVNWKNVAITGRNHSSIVVFAKNPMENIFKKSDVSNESSFTIVNIDKIGENCTVFNCTNEDEFDKAVSTINLFSPGGNIIINLQPKVYNLKCDLNNMLTGHAYLSVGYAPVVINGNGATIKLNRNDYAFANIGVNGILYVNNVTFSGFACVFTNGGNLIVSNCSFINDHDGEDRAFVGMIISTGGKSYVTGCNFKNKPDSFDLREGAELHFRNCDFPNKDKIGTAFDSIIYCPKEFAGKFETRNGSENNYHYNDIITDEGVFDPKPTVNITIENPVKFIMVNTYLKEYTPSSLVLDILCDCNINLNDFNSLESLTIHGNGHKISFNSSTINENLFITVSDLTFSDYKCKCLFENKGIMAFNNCSFINNHFEKYLVNNLEGCIFKNCTFNNNGAEYLMYNEGLLLFSNCSFDNNKISGRIDGKPCLIYSNGIVLIYNSTFINCGNQVVLNYNTLNSILFNSHGIKEVFKIVKPQPLRKNQNLNG